jgi:hypothetical protein
MTPFAVEKLTVYRKTVNFAECLCSIFGDVLASLVSQCATVRSAD